MKRETKNELLRLPTFLIVLAGLVASIYACIKGISDIGFGTVVVFVVAVIAYVCGFIRQHYYNNEEENINE